MKTFWVTHDISTVLTKQTCKKFLLLFIFLRCVSGYMFEGHVVFETAKRIDDIARSSNGKASVFKLKRAGLLNDGSYQLLVVNKKVNPKRKLGYFKYWHVYFTSNGLVCFSWKKTYRLVIAFTYTSRRKGQYLTRASRCFITRRHDRTLVKEF